MSVPWFDEFFKKQSTTLHELFINMAVESQLPPNIQKRNQNIRDTIVTIFYT